jgi:hypothetical protein
MIGASVRTVLACLLALEALASADRVAVAVDGELVTGLPSGMSTGLSTGVGAGIARPGALSYGVRLSWSTATEYTLTEAVRQDDLRLRAFAAIEARRGRGAFGLRLGAGATIVREDRTRDQGGRAGLGGDALERIAWAALPAADLEAVATLRLAGAWSLIVTGGPTIDTLQIGWIGSVGVSWRD